MGTNTNCGASPRAARRSIAPMAASKLDPGRTRSCVAAVAPSTEICTHCDVERRQPVGGGIVDAAAVGFDLERDAAAGEDLEELPAMRHAERLAAAERDIGDAGLDDAPREVERLVAAKLIAPRLVGAGLLAARDAARAAAVGQLPGKEKGRAGTRRPSAPASRIRCGFQVKRMYGCAITCSETSSILGVSQAGFSAGVRLVGLELRRRSSRLRSSASCSLILPPSGHTSATDINCQVLARA